MAQQPAHIKRPAQPRHQPPVLRAVQSLKRILNHLQSHPFIEPVHSIPHIYAQYISMVSLMRRWIMRRSLA